MAQDISPGEGRAPEPRVGTNFLKLTPAWVYSFLIVAAVGFYTWYKALAMGDGTIGYALDDAYIHMAIAKNFAFHGVWGVSPYEAVSSSSSPGWVLLLSFFFKVFGNHDWVPLFLNVLAALGFAYVVDRILRPYAPALLWRIILVTAVLFAVPLPYFISMGMEHTLQVLLIAVYFALARKIAAPGYRLAPKERIILGALCAAMVMIRVEDAVLIPIPFLYALVKRDGWTSVAMAIGPLLALAVFALIAHSQGFGIEPTSMMVKRSHIQVPGVVVISHQEVAYGPQHSVLEWLLLKFWFDLNVVKEVTFFFYGLVAIFLGLLLSPRGRGASIMLVGAALFGFVLHAANGDFGWHSRYEGYLVVFSLLAMAPVCLQALKDWPIFHKSSAENGKARTSGPDRVVSGAVVIFATFSVACLAVRSAFVFATNSRMMMDIGWQQVQMGRFLSRFYAGRNVLLNDIGAPSYLADLHITDIYGLATPAVAKARVDYQWDAKFLKSLIAKNHIDVAIVYVEGLPKILPPDNVPYALIPIARWELPSGAQIGKWVVILAGNPDEAPVLRANLQEFQKELPPGVGVKYSM